MEQRYRNKVKAIGCHRHQSWYNNMVCWASTNTQEERVDSITLEESDLKSASTSEKPCKTHFSGHIN